MINTTIECLPNIAQYSTISEQQGLGLFYIRNSINFGLYSKGSIFQNCRSPDVGSVFNLYKTKFIDEYSIFQNNIASKGGAITCNECNLDFTGSEFYNNQANQGGVIYSEYNVQIKLDQITVLYSNSTSDGGFIYLRLVDSSQNTSKTVVQISNSKQISGNQAQTGGFIFSSNPFAELYLSNIEIQDAISITRGGFMNIIKASKVQIQNSKFYNFRSPEGAFLYSAQSSITFNISNSIFQCRTFNPIKNKTFQIIDQTFNPLTDSQISITNADYVISTNNTFQYCGTTSKGGIFKLQKTKFYDKNSQFQYNSAFIGGVIQCQESVVEITNSKFQGNEAKIGGVFHIVQNSKMTILKSQFTSNFALATSGVIYLESESTLSIYNSYFTQNYAPDNSVIELSTITTSDNPIIIKESSFENNWSIRTLISIMYANVIIENSNFMNNVAYQRTKGLLCGSANITIKGSQFQNDYSPSWLGKLQKEETTGSFIFLISQSIMQIHDSNFINGQANLGGAIFLSGNSQLEIYGTSFLNNKARSKGGAIYASGFRNILISGISDFKDNFAVDQGDDIYLTNSIHQITLNQTYISNKNAKNSIYIEQAKLQSNQLIIKDIYTNKDSKNGGAINCQYCSGLDLINSSFTNIKSAQGGAIYIIDSDFSKSFNDQKYKITNTIFKNCTAETGGAIYATNPESLIISDCQFLANKALFIQELSNQFQNYGSGGAVYYTCNQYYLNCLLKLEGVNLFKQNKASIQGGAIYWDILEPQYSQNDIKFIENSAIYYGDDIACFAQNIKSISKQSYINQMIRVGNQISEDNILRRTLENQLKDSTQNNHQANFNNQRSGGPLPVMYLSLVDKYGQIVGSDFKSTVRIQVNTTNLDTQASKYPPLIEGSSAFTVNSGIAVLQWNKRTAKI
ncbi:UNKNOWN [Stylonychia lemnae]|uniref:Pectin lyase fold/virulence factor n=1 Tax=Stylonychia lemnae TaxID=5949 RepID=A0A078A9B3_STYLE|nr:UNKNOWN [Stylonychia lemnae]|eukprot:CDW78819.1 UNKNOWN [Stylonychia lemnae]